MEIKTPIDMKTLIKNSSLETYDKIKLIERLKNIYYIILYLLFIYYII
jgi:hypothetical protein